MSDFAKDTDVLISRQAAIEAIESHIRTFAEPYKLTRDEEVMNYAFEVAASCVYNLPTTQERKKGKWEKRWHTSFKQEVWCCSICHKFTPMRTPYCALCGAEMKGEDDDEKRS